MGVMKMVIVQMASRHRIQAKVRSSSQAVRGAACLKKQTDTDACTHTLTRTCIRTHTQTRAHVHRHLQDFLRVLQRPLASLLPPSFSLLHFTFAAQRSVFRACKHRTLRYTHTHTHSLTHTLSLSSSLNLSIFAHVPDVYHPRLALVCLNLPPLSVLCCACVL